MNNVIPPGSELTLVEGMTLRDYFAAHCMSDVLGTTNWTDENIGKAATMVWKLADAMLIARDETQT